jgi:integrase
VTLNDVDHYLGRHGTDESIAEYDRLVREWLGRGRRPPTDERACILLKEVILGYVEDCERRLPRVELDKVRDALKVVRRLYGERPVAEFKAPAFLAVRDEMVASGLCITTVRSRLFVVKRMLAWGIVRELVPDKVLNVIKAAEKEEPLRVGRSGVKAPKGVKPAPEEHILAILPHVPPTVAAMLMVQFYSAARPGEVCRMTTGEIDRSVAPWIYRPTRHKTAHLGKSRAIPLGPEARKVISPWLRPDRPDLPLFRPAEGYQHGHKVTGKKARHFRPTYNKDSYAQAVVRGCERAGVPPFRPNRVRHTAGTRIRRTHGLEAAQVIIGHSHANITEIYAEKNLDMATRVVEELG